MLPAEIAIINGFLDQTTVREETGCWIWQGALGRDGYGKTRNPYDRRRTKSTHRLAYRLMIGDIPRRWLVMHACGDRRCVHPMHLRLVPPRTSFADRFRWGIFGWDSEYSPS
jgi:hypothetical protein